VPEPGNKEDSMSLTESADVFASAHEDALNDLITAVCNARPHLLSYGSPGFVPASTVQETQMAPIPFPGTSGIEWHLSFSTPHLDLFDEDNPLPPELHLDPGQFSVATKLRLCVDCDERRDDHPDDHGDDKPDDRPPRGKVRNPHCCSLRIFAVGHLVPTTTAGESAVTFALDALEIVDITPDDLETVLECLLTVILRAVLWTIRIPISALRVGAFQLTPTQGPLVETDVVVVRGDF
jgi:hypothetical protein